VREWIKIWLFIIAISIALFWVTFQFVKPAPKKSLTIATGRIDGTYYEYATKYKELLENEGVNVKIIQTAGSIETLKLLKEKKVDIGFVQGGIADQEAKKTLRSIASIYFEPLWIFTKDKNISYIDDFKGKNISIGEIGSGTKALVEKILTKTNLTDTNSKILYLNMKDSIQKLLHDNLDAFFAVISAESIMIKEMLKNPQISVVELKRVKAYTKEFPFLSELKIYEGELDLKQNIPSKDILLLSSVASLVTQKDLDDYLVRLISVQVVKVSLTKGFASSKYLDIPIHEEAKRYLQNGESWLEKIFPYWVASNIDRLKILLIPTLTLLIPLLKGFFPLYKWRSRSKIYRWYDELNEIDKKIDTISKDEAKEYIDQIQKLQDEIKEHTKVPLSFMGEYYELNIHIDYVLNKLKTI